MPSYVVESDASHSPAVLADARRRVRQAAEGRGAVGMEQHRNHGAEPAEHDARRHLHAVIAGGATSKGAEMKRKLTLTAGGLVLAAAYFVASALPAFSADSGTVSATVTPAVACLTLDISSVDFGSPPFSTPSRTSRGGYPGVDVHYPALTNCGGSEATILARGTNASGAGGAWTLTPVDGNPCDEGVDKYHQWVNAANLADGTLGIPLRLSTTDQQFKVNYSASTKDTLGPGASVGTALVVDLPCAGSTGAGVAMGFSYIFTATL